MTKTEQFILVNCILIWVIATSLFSDRIVLQLSTGGRGVLQISSILTPVLAFNLFLLTKGKVISFFSKTKFLIYFFPFILLTLTLPFLGILFTDYPIRTTYLSMTAVNILSLIMLGYWIGRKSKIHARIFFLIERYLFLGIFLQFLYSLGQFLYRNKLIGSVWLPFYQWDIDAHVKNGIDIIYGRSTGFYLNPNVLGFWSAISIWVSILLLKSKRKKYFGILASLCVLVFSQSRGAMIAFILSFMSISLYKVLTTGKVIHPLKVIVSLIIFIPTYIYLIKYMIEDTLLTRYLSAINVFNSGISADANLSLRVIAWTDAFEMLGRYPLGTFGSPELLFGSYIDNDWVRLLLQGGIAYPISLFLLIIGSFSLVKNSVYGSFLAISSFVIAVCALTQTPLTYAPMTIFWFFLGFVLSSKKEDLPTDKNKQVILQNNFMRQISIRTNSDKF